MCSARKHARRTIKNMKFCYILRVYNPLFCRVGLSVQMFPVGYCSGLCGFVSCDIFLPLNM